MYEFKQGSTGNVVHVSIASSTTGIGTTGLAHDSPTFVLKKPGSGAAAKTVAGSEWVEVGGGWYEVKLLAGDVDTLGSCLLVVTPSGGGPEGGYPFDVVANIASDVKTDTAAIKARTDNLPSTPAAQSDVTTVGTAVAAVSTKLGTPAASVSADVAAVKADTAAVKVKTDNLPANPASQTNLDVAVSTRLATIGYTTPDNAGIATAAANAASALAMASYVLDAFLGLHLVMDVSYASGTKDVSQIVYRLYDSLTHSTLDDGVTGLVRQSTRNFAYGVDLSGGAHQVAQGTGV